MSVPNRTLCALITIVILQVISSTSRYRFIFQPSKLTSYTVRLAIQLGYIFWLGQKVIRFTIKFCGNLANQPGSVVRLSMGISEKSKMRRSLLIKRRSQRLMRRSDDLEIIAFRQNISQSDQSISVISAASCKGDVTTYHSSTVASVTRTVNRFWTIFHNHTIFSVLNCNDNWMSNVK